jgi:hypothetical protein
MTGLLLVALTFTPHDASWHDDADRSGGVHPITGSDSQRRSAVARGTAGALDDRMMLLSRVVDADTWVLSKELGERRSRLLDVPSSSIVAAAVVGDAECATKDGQTLISWVPSLERPGYYRLEAQIPLREITFDHFFNGRSGYRAQYYLSPAEGIRFNIEILRALGPALKHANRLQRHSADWDLIEHSLLAPHSKLWVFDDKAAFDEATADTLNPQRWVENADALRGRRAPLPGHLMIDVKGAFIHPITLDVFVDEFKADRACDLFRKGFS